MNGTIKAFHVWKNFTKIPVELKWCWLWLTVLMEPSFVKGYNMVQECITFIMVPFKVKVTSSMYVPLLSFRKVVWDVWCNFLHPNDVFNDVTNIKIPFPNVHSLVLHYPVPVHFQQWLTSWTFSPGMIIHSINHGEKLSPTTQQLSTVMHLCHMIPADHTSNHVYFDPGMLFQTCRHTLWCYVMRWWLLWLVEENIIHVG